jgi:hypothetical protein
MFIERGVSDPFVDDAVQPAVADGRTHRSLRSLLRSPLNGVNVGRTRMTESHRTALIRSLGRPLMVFGILFVVTTFFSLFSTPAIRGLRNVGIIACYLALVVGVFKMGWKRTLLAWVIFGLLSGVLYFAYELVAHSRASKVDESRPSVTTVLHGLLAWPIMAPEAVEYTLADLGVLKTIPAPTPKHGGPRAPPAERGPPKDENPK